jgi:Tol biopolymer transport system component
MRLRNRADRAGLSIGSVRRTTAVPWLITPAALALANVVTIASLTATQPTHGWLPGFSDPARPTYAAGLLRGFAHVTDRFIHDVLDVDETQARAPLSPSATGQAAPLRSSPRTREVQSGVSGTARGGPANDDFFHAYEIRSVPFSGRSNTRSYTRQTGEPATCSPVGGTAWYRYTPRTSGSLLADTFGSNYPLALAVYSGGSLGTLRAAGCNTSATGNAQLGLGVIAGTSYFFQVTGPVGGGDLLFNLTYVGLTDRVSVSSSGKQSGGVAGAPAVSADGRYIAFTSTATDLDGSTQPQCPGCMQIFVRDRVTGSTTLESVSSSGTPANQTSGSPAISADGRYIAFWSRATNLGQGEVVPIVQVYLRDRLLKTTTMISVTSQGSPGDGASDAPSLSADGRVVEFTSWASNLRPGGGVPCGVTCASAEGTQLGRQVQTYVRDLATSRTVLVSVGPSGQPPNDGAPFGTIAADGRHAAFASGATNILPGVTSGTLQVFERDLATGAVVLVSRSPGGVPGNQDSGYPMALSQDGRYIAFLSLATNLVRNQSAATSGVPNGFFQDVVTGRTELVSVSSSGRQATTPPGASSATTGPAGVISSLCVISADGRFVAFNSSAPDLVSNDTNGVTDVFIHDTVTGATVRDSVSSTGGQGNGPSFSPAISADGRVVAFASSASNLVDGDTNDSDDVFVHENELAP